MGKGWGGGGYKVEQRAEMGVLPPSNEELGNSLCLYNNRRVHKPFDQHYSVPSCPMQCHP